MAPSRKSPDSPPPSSRSPKLSRKKSFLYGFLQPRGRGLSIFLRVARTLFLLGLLGGFLALAGIAGLFLYYTRGESLPTIDRVSDYHPKVVTRVLAQDGQLIGELFEERRTVVPRERVPRLVMNAFI